MVTTSTKTELKSHPAADIFPLMMGDEYDRLVKSISADGLEVPIMLHDGMILDGRNRYRACKEVGAEPRSVEWKGDGSPADYVWRMNVHRRHLNEGQIVLCNQARRKQNEAASNHGGVRRGDQFQDATSSVLNDEPKTAARDARSSAGITAKELGVSRALVGMGKRVEEEAPELVEEVMSRAMTLTQANRKLKERKRQAERDANAEKIAAAPKPETLVGVYSTIVIDPPWAIEDEGDVGTGSFGRTAPTYETMSIEDIEKIPVGDRAADNCHLYLWITNRSLPKGFGLLEAWGFRYVTMLTWVKSSFGMGRYFRGQTEHILFGVRGSLPLKRKDVGTVFEAPRGPKGHSSKPTEFYDLVESCSPGPYLEMFARSERYGWAVWGEDSL